MNDPILISLYCFYTKDNSTGFILCCSYRPFTLPLYDRWFRDSFYPQDIRLLNSYTYTSAQFQFILFLYISLTHNVLFCFNFLPSFLFYFYFASVKQSGLHAPLIPLLVMIVTEYLTMTNLESNIQ